MAEDPGAQASSKPSTQPAGKPSTSPAGRPATRRWVTRVEAIATLTLVFVFLAWVGVIVVRQGQAGRDLHWVPGQNQGAEYRVDINRAELPELMLLPGIGPTKAERIIKWRQEHGPFRALEELRNAAGITARDLAAIRSLVTLGEPAPEPPSDADYADPETE